MVKCSSSQCIRNESGDHEFDGELCVIIPVETMPDDDQMLILYKESAEFDPENPSSSAQQFSFTSYDDNFEINENHFATGMTSTTDFSGNSEKKQDSITVPSESSLQVLQTEAINEFFARWSKIEKQTILSEEPYKVFEDIEADMSLKKYWEIFSSARLKFSSINSKVLSIILKEFIGSASVTDFERFDVYARGVFHCYEGFNKLNLDKLSAAFEANLSTVANNASEIKETSGSLNNTCDLLRENINSITAVTSKLKAEMKIFESTRQNNSHSVGKAINILGYQCGNMFIPINKRGRIDMEAYKAIYPNSSNIDLRILGSLEMLSKEYLTPILALNWDQIKSLYPDDPYLSAKDGAALLYVGFNRKFRNISPRSPQKYTIPCPLK